MGLSKKGRTMKYNISITKTTDDGAAFVEGVLTNVADVPEDERAEIIFDYMRSLLERLEKDV